MTLLTPLYDLAIQTIASFFQQLALIIILILGFRLIIREIKKIGSEIIKNLPTWIDKWDEVKKKNRRIDNALSMRQSLAPLTDEQIKTMTRRDK